MIKQRIDALRLTVAVHRLKDDLGCRFSLLDMICLLYINEHKGCGQLEILEFINYAKPKGKSLLDKPLKRLVDAGLIDRHYDPTARRKLEEPQVTYSISEKGEAFLIQ
ncbi:hypothetical protein ACP3V3_19810 [Vibrio sp. PNB22_3_1]